MSEEDDETLKVTLKLNEAKLDKAMNALRSTADPTKLLQLAESDLVPSQDRKRKRDAANDEVVKCPVCVENPMHRTELECGHVYCFLCVKGLVEYAAEKAQCVTCGQSITSGYLGKQRILERFRADLEQTEDSEDEADDEARGHFKWFYESARGGTWWRFEARDNDDLEAAFKAGLRRLDTLICGHNYIVDFVDMMQVRADDFTKRRRIKRDLYTTGHKGVAGLMPKV